jgi:iron donor protein CyaY
MKDSDFSQEFESLINLIAEAIENQDTDELIDVDINGGILTISNDNGVYVINKQSAVKEVWLSSPVSGPYHFAKEAQRWKARNGAELLSILNKELQVNIK